MGVLSQICSICWCVIIVIFGKVLPRNNEAGTSSLRFALRQDCAGGRDKIRERYFFLESTFLEVHPKESLNARRGRTYLGTVGKKPRVAFWSGSCTKAWGPEMLQPPPSLTALFLESRSKLLETNGLGMLPSSYRYPEGQWLHGRQGGGAVEGQGYRMAAYSKFPTAWKGRMQVPRLGTSFGGEGGLHKNCGDAVSFSPIPAAVGLGQVCCQTW